MLNKISILSSILLGLCIIANAQQVTPSASFEVETHDFGTVKELGGPVKYDFKFVNVGGAPLILKDVHASCGCTTPQWPREPILPGEDAAITVSYNPNGRPGSIDKQVTVVTNGTPETIILRIKGNVVSKPPSIEDRLHQSIDGLRMEDQTIRLGNVTPDQKITKTFDVYNSLDTPMNISFSNVPKYIKVFIKDKILQPKQASIIEIAYDVAANKEWGEVINHFNLVVNGKKSAGNVITLNAVVRDDFSKLTEEQKKDAPVIDFDKVVFNFDTIQQGKVKEFAFKVKNKGKSDLIIRKVNVTCGCTVTKVKSSVIKPGGESEIKVTFDPKNRKGKQTSPLYVYSNDPRKSLALLKIEGFVK
jgi:hypothetical protein